MYYKTVFVIVALLQKCNYRVLIRVCACVFLNDNSKNNCCRSIKLENIVVYENVWDKFVNEPCRTKVKVTVGFEIFISGSPN